MTDDRSPRTKPEADIKTRPQQDVSFKKKVGAIFHGFFGAVGLFVFPYPLLNFRRALAGRTLSNGDLEFYCHPRFAITSHVIVVGWLATLGFMFLSPDGSTSLQRLFAWPWLATIALTFVAMGRDWEIISSLFVGGTIVLLLSIAVIVELLGDWQIFRPLLDLTRMIPVGMNWGGPFLLSIFLGSCYVVMAAYQRVDDVWRLPATGNLLDHYRFERSDTSISKGGKTFRADWPCMLKKWFFFGYGDILILDAHSKRILHTIKGVFFARYHAEILKTRFATTDTFSVDDEIMLDQLNAEEEEHGHSDNP